MSILFLCFFNINRVFLPPDFLGCSCGQNKEYQEFVLSVRLAVTETEVFIEIRFKYMNYRAHMQRY